MKVHGNYTGLEREREKEVKENWKVGRIINQTGYARGEIYLGRWKCQTCSVQEHPKIRTELKTQIWRPVVKVEKVVESLQSEPELERAKVEGPVKRVLKNDSFLTRVKTILCQGEKYQQHPFHITDTSQLSLTSSFPYLCLLPTSLVVSLSPVSSKYE